MTIAESVSVRLQPMSTRVQWQWIKYLRICDCVFWAVFDNTCWTWNKYSSYSSPDNSDLPLTLKYIQEWQRVKRWWLQFNPFLNGLQLMFHCQNIRVTHSTGSLRKIVIGVLCSYVNWSQLWHTLKEVPISYVINFRHPSNTSWRASRMVFYTVTIYLIINCSGEDSWCHLCHMKAAIANWN